ncbi:dipeptide ABC transporter ATP-binding protein [Nonomuraea soli]|uniref:Peptide/nickel transport system ATP-binding protein n=1 Tax=Nonomuraea soli TaxID=1032476 RepID=A0A7W0HN69_9ACTN|nr:ABC transporter ATP-binding protein [Nonomuraea soli]MBA2889479.1 peptide/nickel transport system ATP-binding protein [Nonomuraea soli]
MSLVSIDDLRVSFAGTQVVRGISLTIEPGECVAIVGESGSGKSVTARSLLGLAGPGSRVEASRFLLGGENALAFGERQWRRVRGRFAGLVLQDALVSLDPLRTVRAEIAESLRRPGPSAALAPAGSTRQRVLDLLTAVGVPEPETRLGHYPHQLSGGLRQRVLIASAIAADPPLIIADEPTTALDVTVQAQILRLLAERKAAGTALLLISHDLAVVASVADRILVMKDGLVVEQGSTARVLGEPTHPYTRRLLAAVPSAASRGHRLSDGTRVTAERPRSDEVVLSASGLSFSYGTRTVAQDIGFVLHRAETLGVVGESGSGKTTLARLALGLLKPTSGTVTLLGSPWSGVTEKSRRPLRPRIQVISQNPLDSFDPRYTVARLVSDHRRLPEERIEELLEYVGLDLSFAARRPRDLSGGQRQRVAIARALGYRPDVLICDEPVSALDVSVQAQVLDLLADLQAELGMAMVFISHDLGVVHHVSDRVLVMKDGRVVESGEADDIFFDPGHPYTRELLAAVPGPVVGVAAIGE